MSKVKKELYTPKLEEMKGGWAKAKLKKLRFHINGEFLTKADHDALPFEVRLAANNVVTSAKRK